MHPPDASRTARCAPGVAIPVVLFLASAVIPASLAAQTFTRENYYEALPVPPAITAQTEASQLFHLYGDTLDTAYQDLAPRDGVDDSRGARLLWLAESFSPILRRNTNLLPLEFEDALAADVALQVDAWRDYLRVDSGTIRLGRRITDIDDEAYVLAGERLSAPDDDLLLRLLETRGPRRVRSSVHSPDPVADTILFIDIPGEDEFSWRPHHARGLPERTRITPDGRNGLLISPLIPN